MVELTLSVVGLDLSDAYWVAAGVVDWVDGGRYLKVAVVCLVTVWFFCVEISWAAAFFPRGPRILGSFWSTLKRTYNGRRRPSFQSFASGP